MIIGVKLGLFAEVGSIGPQYIKGILRGTEPLLCDICKDCGEVDRLYVNDTNRDFIK